MPINFDKLTGVDIIDPKKYMMFRLPNKNLVKVNAFSRGEKVAIEFDIRHFLDFDDVCGIVADFVTEYKTPLPVTRGEALQLLMHWTARNGTFKGLDREKVNKHTIYGATVKVAVLFADFFAFSQVPNNILVPPEGYDKTKVQYIRPRKILGCQAKGRQIYDDGSKRDCVNAEDYLVEIQGDALGMHPTDADGNRVVPLRAGHRTI